MSIFNLFWDPDPFEGDPVGFAVNQILHFAVIGVLPVWLGVPALIVVAIFAAWEIAQVIVAKGGVWDGLEDFGFVAAGAMSVVWWPVGLLALVFLASGAARRFDL